jgi:hypothetical protein
VDVVAAAADDNNNNDNNNNNNNNNKMDHIISACLMLAKEQYIQRHGRVYAELHCTTFKRIAVTFDRQHWYQDVPKPLERIYDGNIIMLWNQQVKTDRSVPNNKPENIIHDNEKGTCMLSDLRCQEMEM